MFARAIWRFHLFIFMIVHLVSLGSSSSIFYAINFFFHVYVDSKHRWLRVMMFLAIAATGRHHQIRSRRRCAFHHHLLSNLLFVAAATFR